MTKEERSGGWRDKEISERHRYWYGSNCPMVNFDFLVVEYDHLEPMAIIDYKHYEKGLQPWEPLKDPNFQVLVKVADRLGVPCLIAIYKPKDWWYRVFPLNDAARRFYEYGQDLTEVEYVQSLYRLRGRDGPLSRWIKPNAHVQDPLSDLKMIRRHWNSSARIDRARDEMYG